MKYPLLLLTLFCFGLAPLLGWPMDPNTSEQTKEKPTDPRLVDLGDRSKTITGSNDQASSSARADDSVVLGEDANDLKVSKVSDLKIPITEPFARQPLMRSTSVRRSIGRSVSDGRSIGRSSSDRNSIGGMSSVNSNTKASTARRYSIGVLSPINQGRDELSLLRQNEDSFSLSPQYSSPQRSIGLERDTLNETLLLNQEAILTKRRSVSEAATQARNEANEAMANFEAETNNVVENQQRLSLHYDIQNKIVASFLPRRDALLKEVTELNEEDADTTASSIKAIQKIGRSLLNSIEPSANPSDEACALISELMPLVEELQFFTLGCKAQHYINRAKEELAAAEQHMSEFNKYEDVDLLEPFQKLLESARVDFLFAEAQSPKAAAVTAQSKATALQAEVDLLRDDLPRIENEIREARPDQGEMLIQKTNKMKAVAIALEEAVLAYQQLDDEDSIEEKTGPLLQRKEKIEASINVIRERATDATPVIVNSTLDQLVAQLTTLSTGLENEYLQPRNPLEFLDKIDALEAVQDSDRIIGANGKVALAVQEEAAVNSSFIQQETFSKELRTAWGNGIDLIRFGLCRNFNIHAVRRFDLYFKTKIDMNNSLRVLELKKFLEGEKKFHTSSHFLSPLDSMDDLQERLANAEADKIIKWDEKTMTFNPFAGEASGLEIKESPALNEQEIRAGRDYAREAIKKMFTADSLLRGKIEKILQRFDAQFPIVDTEKLTVGAFRDFIECEKSESNIDEGGCWNRYTTPYFINGVQYGLGSAIASTTVALIYAHILSIIALWHVFQHWLSGLV